MTPFTPNADQEFYHVTETEKAASIYEKGLTIGNKRVWSNSLGGKQGDQKAVYLFSDFSDALRFAHKLFYGGRYKSSNDVTILRVRGIDWELVPDDHIEAQMARVGGKPHSWWKSYKEIPADLIGFRIFMSREMLRTLVSEGSAEPLEEDVVGMRM